MKDVPDPHHWNSCEPDPRESEAPEPEEELENQDESIDLEKSQNSQEWEQIENQLNHWRDIDIQYWRQRKEKEYRAYFERKLETSARTLHEQAGDYARAELERNETQQ